MVRNKLVGQVKSFSLHIVVSSPEKRHFVSSRSDDFESVRDRFVRCEAISVDYRMESFAFRNQEIIVFAFHMIFNIHEVEF